MTHQIDEKHAMLRFKMSTVNDEGSDVENPYTTIPFSPYFGYLILFKT